MNYLFKMNALKLFTSEQIRRWDAATISELKLNSADLMETAASACADWLLTHKQTLKCFHVFCGPGNNGGDGLAIARLLADKGKTVKVYVLNGLTDLSDDFKANELRLQQQNKTEQIRITNTQSLPVSEDGDCIIDALFGTGLSRPVDGLAAACIQYINNSPAAVVAIDLPSGLFADVASPENAVIVKADDTLSFQVPKLAFLHSENEIYCGHWHVLGIGLSSEFYASETTDAYILDKLYIRSLLKHRSKFAHKGQFGHALLMAGSYGKMGAAVLAASAALRSGLGLLSVHAPRCGDVILQTAVPEVMLTPDEHEYVISAVGKLFAYDAVGVGPGIGTSEETDYALEELLKQADKPMVIDADAINLLAMDPELLGLLPKGSVLTPHPKEFERLAGKCKNSFERHKRQIDFARSHGVYILLKGAYTCLTTPEGISYYNNTGNPGMAKGGSGDVLTGLITGLLAQAYTPLQAALIGTYVHGLAGDIAAEKYCMTGMKAGDIVESLPEAFRQIAKG